jgi:transposase
MRSNRKYGLEFQKEAVLLVVEQGLTIREVESKHGMTHGVLKGWVQKHRENQGASSVAPGSPEAGLKSFPAPCPLVPVPFPLHPAPCPLLSTVH